MARAVEELVLQMSADVRRMEKALDRAEGKFDKTARNIERRQKELDRKLAELGSTVGDGFGRLSATAAVAFGAISGYALMAARDAEAVRGAFDDAFKDIHAQASAAADGIAKEFGRAPTEIRNNFVQAFSVLRGLGVEGEQALRVVEELQKRALDLAAFRDTSDAEAFKAVLSTITGETEPMKRFGAVINETAVKAELLRLGFKGNAQQASEAAKALARANLILKNTELATGAVARESEGLAEQTKRTRAEFQTAAEEWGRQFLPIAKDVVSWASDALKAFNDLPKGAQNAGLGLLALVAAGGPIASVAGGLVKLITLAKEARLALAGVGGASAAAGAGGAAGGLASAAGLAGAPVAVGVLGGAAIGVSAAKASDYKQTKQMLMVASDQALAAAIGYARNNIANLEKQGATTGRGAQLLNEYRADLRRLESEVGRRADNAGKAAATAADEAARSAQASFTLGEDLKKPGGDADGGAGKAAKLRRDAERAAEASLRQQERTDGLLAQADFDLLSIRQQTAVEAGERHKLELEAIDRERAARREELDYAVAQKELTQAQRDLVDAAEERVRQRQVELAGDARDEQLQRESRDQRLAAIEMEGRALGLRADLARTTADRRAAEMRILALQIEEEKIRLQGVIDTKGISANQKEIARLQLQALEDLQADSEESVRKSTRGALEQFTDGIPRTIGEVNDALQEMAAEGLDNLTTGLADAIVTANDLGDVARNVFRQIASDLITMAIRQNVTGPLAAILGGKIPGFRSGTNSAPGGLAYVHQGELLVNLPKGSQVIPRHVLNALGASSAKRSGGGQILAPMQFDLRGAVLTEQLLGQMNQMAAQSMALGARGGATIAQAELARRSRRQL